MLIIPSCGGKSKCRTENEQQKSRDVDRRGSVVCLRVLNLFSEAQTAMAATVRQ
jgi:hypothetical protein